ncbi:MAG: BACON domain-containing protein, partial [Alistipes sp.]|nr:BACON domain-containing protein [Alistipes sp.]
MKRFFTLIMAIFAFALAACTSSGSEEENVLTLSIAKDKFDINANGETIAVEVTSNVAVTVEIPTNVNWVKMNNSRASATKTYYFDVSPNNDYTPRSTTIKFTSNANNLSKSISINQVQKDAIVIASDNYTVAKQGGEINIEVGHNVDFDVEISESWITTNSTRAFENETLTFKIAANDSDDDREGTIKFISKDKAITQTVKVSQSGYDPTKPRKNEIWYTSADGNTINPGANFNVNIVSNTYEDGKGVIKFDGNMG